MNQWNRRFHELIDLSNYSGFNSWCHILIKSLNKVIYPKTYFRPFHFAALTWVSFYVLVGFDEDGESENYSADDGDKESYTAEDEESANDEKEYDD